MVAMYLSKKGIAAASINGDRGQHLREQALLDFRRKVISVLVATDVCARGIDIPDLDHVSAQRWNAFNLLFTGYQL